MAECVLVRPPGKRGSEWLEPRGVIAARQHDRRRYVRAEAGRIEQRERARN
jgi:hypothetical protein